MLPIGGRVELLDDLHCYTLLREGGNQFTTILETGTVDRVQNVGDEPVEVKGHWSQALRADMHNKG